MKSVLSGTNETVHDIEVPVLQRLDQGNTHTARNVCINKESVLKYFTVPC